MRSKHTSAREEAGGGGGRRQCGCGVGSVYMSRGGCGKCVEEVAMGKVVKSNEK